MPSAALFPSAPSAPRRGIAAASIDDLLGPARDRYFGEGYRRVGHELRDVAIDAAPGADGVTALAWVAYPGDWATKRAGTDLRPHLSSLDMLVIGAELCEAYLVHRYALDPAQRRRMWLRRIAARAGQQPQEALDGFTVTAKFAGTRPLDDQPGRFVSSFECTIGTMRVRCEVGHEINRRLPGPGWYARIDWLLGPADRRYYGAGFRSRGYELRDIGIDPCNTYADCVVRVAPDSPESAAIGMEADYQPCVTMAESVMLTAQLSEVILYRTDGIERQASNTMWLRSLTMERPDPAAGWRGTQFTGSIAVSKSRVVTLNGERWRIVDMVAYCHGIEQTHSLAHQLPATAESR
jgi:hypothetical protein